jgi:2,3-dihydroxyphenylpropionate 1,2-dioxygenase
VSAVQLLCASHSPLMVCYARPPQAHDAIVEVFRARAKAIAEFDPELVFVLGPDHFNGFFFKLAPSFCVGLSCEAVADIGGTPGRMNVPRDLATECVKFLRQFGSDVAVSYEMTVDHGFSQTMSRVFGGLDRYPVIPIYVNAIMPPYLPFKRSRALGMALGEFIKTLNKRVLVLASGGMSHNPTRYYPSYGSAEEAVTRWQLGGDSGGGLARQEWLDKLEDMHLEGAQMLVSGARSRADIKLNPEIDGRFLSIVTSGSVGEIDEWDPDEMVEQAGIGWMEMHTWVAACAANETAGGALPETDLYAETLEYGIATGIIHAG